MNLLWILDRNLVAQDTAVLTASSEDAEFPVSNLKDPGRSFVWRSPVGEGTFVITTSNNKINFKESSGGSELTATITPGTYAAPDLASEIQTRMEAAGAASYTVTHSAGLWTIAGDGVYLALLWATGTDVANSIGPSLGFAASDLTNALIYTGATVAIHTSEWIVVDSIASEESDAFVVHFNPMESIGYTAQATFRLQANASNSWGSPAFDQVVTLDDIEKVISLFQSSPIDYRFRRLEIVDPTNPNLFVEVAKMVIAKATRTSFGPSSGFKTTIRDSSKISENEYGHHVGDVYPLRRGWKFEYTILTDDDVQLLEQIFQQVGSVVPITIVLDPLEVTFKENRFVLYCRFAREFSTNHINWKLFGSGADLEESM